MSHAEFVDWAAFASIEPLPEARADLRNALSMLILAHIHRGKGGKKLKLEMFLPDWWADRRDPRRLAAKFMALTANLNEEEAALGAEQADGGSPLGAEEGKRRG
jgi:hypothetical protein